MPGYGEDGTGSDPDPTDFLYVSEEQKERDLNRPYDPEYSCWVPDEKEGFIEGEIQATKDDLVTVCAGTETKDWKKDMVQEANPPKFEKCEDMCEMTHLNSASILHNLKSRFSNKLIYTYSGSSCIMINPYKRYPIYTDRVVEIYQGKRRNEAPPHLFGISGEAYASMLQDGENQSLLITGESGAGKTENAKKVLSYFAKVAATASEANEEEGEKRCLEERILQTNPILEAFGNAKTSRNDNASRFVKFMRLHFQRNGKLSGADIEVFLLDKGRLITQESADRSFHIFYQMMSDQVKEIRPMCSLSDDIYDYQCVTQGTVNVATIKDKDGMQICHDAFDILGFSEVERGNVYKLTASVLHFGEMAFKQRGNEEQAEPDGTEAGRMASKLLGVEADDLFNAIIKPKVKVGAEFVAKGVNAEQCLISTRALAKVIYERVFKWIATKCNAILENGQEPAFFIGILDIPGFESFDQNNFEQLCINFSNEKFQQFYNYYNFVRVQEEYKKEGIEWTCADLVLDLQPTINFFEKEMGLMPIMDAESMTPSGTEKTFAEKLNANHLDKTPAFTKPKPPKPDQPEDHFAIVHYAGTVSYNLTGWLEKNKEPLNESMVDLLKSSSNELCVAIFADHPGTAGVAEAKKGEKGSETPSFKTASASYKEQLDNLVQTLNATHPHFLRCFLPNETKSPGVIDAALVMQQLTCNGVLEALGVARKTYPSKMAYAEFRKRYKIFASKETVSVSENKKASKKCLDRSGLAKDFYRAGKTKVFFRAGATDKLEELREERVGKLISMLQAWILGFSTRKTYAKLQEKRMALQIVQRNLRKYIKLHSWKWYELFEDLKPLLNVTKIEDEMKALAEKTAKALEDLEKESKIRKDLEVQNLKLQEEKYDLMVTLETSKGDIKDFLEKTAKLQSQKADLEMEMEDTCNRLQKEEEARTSLSQTKKKLEHNLNGMKQDLEDMELAMHKAQHAAAAKEQVIQGLKEEINSQEELIKKLKKEKKQLQEVNQKTGEDNQNIEDKCTHLNLLKSNLEQHLEKLEGFMDHEKKLRSAAEREKRKAESDLKMTQAAVSEFNRTRKELEQNIDRKNKDVSALTLKVEEDVQQINRQSKQIKDMEKRQAELEAEILQERQARSAAETARVALSHEVTDLNNRLNEASAVATAQMEMNKNREADVAKLRSDLKEKAIHFTSTLAQQQKKHNEALEGMTEQIDDLCRTRARVENEREQVKKELEAAKNSMDRFLREESDAEKTNKQLQHQLLEIQTRYDDAVRSLGDYESNKKRLMADNKDLVRQLEETEKQVEILSKLKMSLDSDLQETRIVADEQRQLYTMVQDKYRSLDHDIGRLRERLEEECDNSKTLQRLLSKATDEAAMWRSKYEVEGVARSEELEIARQKLSHRLEETEAKIDQLNVKNTSLEKIKLRTAMELVELQGELQRTKALVEAAEEKQKSFETEVEEWKTKVDTITNELEASRKECKKHAAENSRVNAVYKETLAQVDSLRDENKGLSHEINGLTDDIASKTDALHKLQLAFKRLKGEKGELQADLEEAEAALDQEEIKVQRGQMELNQVKEEMERRVQEKEEEFEKSRKFYMSSVESLRVSLETEVKDKAEAIYLKKKLESEVQQLQSTIQRAKEANSDLQKAYERLEKENEEQQARIEDTERVISQQREHLSSMERRMNSLMGELEEAHTLLEQADRSRRSADVNLTEANDYIRKLTAENENLEAAKERLEEELQSIQNDFEDMIKETRSAEDKAKRTLMDANRLNDELKGERENAKAQERLRKDLEVSLREMQARLDDDTSSQKVGRAAFENMEARARDLEMQLEQESTRYAESQKNLRRSERRVKELTLRTEEDQKNHESMQDLVDKLQQKIKGYKRQMEEAEEIAALNLAKYRKAQQELEEFEENTSSSHKVTRMETTHVF